MISSSKEEDQSTSTNEDRDQSTSANEDRETNCWGCGLRVSVATFASVFKCGWCGAITKEHVVKNDNIRLRRCLDRFFVIIVISFMLFFICAGVWAVYPIIFSVSYFRGVFHLAIIAILSICTLSSFFLSAFQPAGIPPLIIWGSFPAVGQGGLDNYTFCHYCSKPKSPMAHHCRSCGTCVLDMDHHCPFIGNCVGAANHRCFILFLLLTVISTFYVTIMTSYSALQIWPHQENEPVIRLSGYANRELIFGVLKETILAFLRSAVFLPVRGLVLVYLFLSSLSVSIGLSVLLWQQLSYIYVGKTYLSHLRAVDSEEVMERDCKNIVRFFGCSSMTTAYLPSYWKSRKAHTK
ncbi:protein S-acyltransferase 11-like [Salvia splendens]|uniref:protein S-acyltransferase 11-like n=1 Tax=Salvia splendens TaxID=180675 RepID=UPI001C26A03A|nr:protein S-acyltransferase 11-like [Salvia splendens]XP_042055297.1 protein S-acyltransferase 11-like [Salvia splendens]